MSASSSASFVRDAMCDAFAETGLGASWVCESFSSMDSSIESIESASSVGVLTDARTETSRARNTPGKPPLIVSWHLC